MMPEPIRILGTRRLAPDLEDRLYRFGFMVDNQSFIETIPIRDRVTDERISKAAAQAHTVIFTSAQAVSAVLPSTTDRSPDWDVYCIGAATKEQVISLDPRLRILGTAPDASQLAELIISEKPIRPLIFFCSDRRRPDLPEQLKKAGLPLEEVIVYKTIELDVTVNPIYDGLLFFSPSAVTSFFRHNKPKAGAAFFAIGRTTAAALKEQGYTNVIMADEPTQEALVQAVTTYFSKPK